MVIGGLLGPGRLSHRLWGRWLVLFDDCRDLTGQVLGSWRELLKAWWSKLSRLQLTQDLAFVDNGKAAVHAVM